ncbi:MAG: vitamin B12 dependent-methionine synthase activation domain-containing protein [Candidatus Heimdallarchaeaceae archaeon]|jgi:hypothetical protein
MNFIEGFQISLDDSEILRLLRNQNTTRIDPSKVSVELMEEIKEMKKVAFDLIKPQAIYDIFESNDLKPKSLFKESEKTILAVCTIGGRLEEESLKLMKEGELSKGVILDAIASHAAEQTASFVNKAILEVHKEEIKDKQITNRFSPGYCVWTVEDGQDLIFGLLPTTNIGVELSKSKMMIPRKSVSFAINIGEVVDSELGSKVCENCSLINCPFRRLN